MGRISRLTLAQSGMGILPISYGFSEPRQISQTPDTGTMPMPRRTAGQLAGAGGRQRSTSLNPTWFDGEASLLICVRQVTRQFAALDCQEPPRKNRFWHH
jgi:hypothetical protein